MGGVMADSSADTVVEFVGVYHADGGPIGEAKYILGHLFGTAHCALCDITHSPVRRKPQWDAMVRRLGVPVTLVHLNEMPPAVSDLVGAVGSPLIAARLSDRSLHPLLGSEELDALAGSVPRTEAAIRATVRDNDWRLPGDPSRAASDQHH
jgi:hypothetical protein